MEPDNTVTAEPGAPQLSASEPVANDGKSPQTVAELTLAEINQRVGRDFKDKDTALKALEDTFKFVSTRKTDLETKVKSEVDETYKKLAQDFASQQREMFYLQHPEYASQRKLIESMGANPQDVVQSDVFKDAFNKLSEYDKTVKLKTVLESNPRIAASKDSFTKAAELKSKQNGVVNEAVERLVTKAVQDAFPVVKR